MELIRNWILQIAGIIVMGALCDMIMPEGEIKKYVKMVVGVIMVFAVMKPIGNLSDADIKIEIPADPVTEAIELQQQLGEAEQKEIIRLYCVNIEKKIENELKVSFKCDMTARVTVVEEKGSDFGRITGVVIENDEDVDKAEIINVICEKFGVKPEEVTFV